MSHKYFHFHGGFSVLFENRKKSNQKWRQLRVEILFAIAQKRLILLSNNFDELIFSLSFPDEIFRLIDFFFKMLWSALHNAVWSIKRAHFRVLRTLQKSPKKMAWKNGKICNFRNKSSFSPFSMPNPQKLRYQRDPNGILKSTLCHGR